MAVKVFIDGAISDGADAKISVFDRGFLYGDSVYEVMRTSAGRPVDLERHLDRLERSASAIGLRASARPVIGAAIAETLSASQNAESYVRVILTRGSGEIGLDVALADRARLLVIVRPLVLPPQTLYERGATIRIVGVRRTSREAVDPAVKSGNYLNNILALAEAKRAGAYEAIMLSPDGLVAEGSTSNVFAVADGEVSTPAIAVGLLAGITRQRVIELATAQGQRIREGALSPDALRAADEVFITSSIRGVMPIGCVDDRELAAPGPVTQKLLEAYAEFLAEQAAL